MSSKSLVICNSYYSAYDSIIIQLGTVLTENIQVTEGFYTLNNLGNL